MSYYISNDPLAKNIYNLMDNPDNKLSQRSKTNTYYYQKKQNNIIPYPYKNLGNYRNNSITSSPQFNQNNLSNNVQLSNYDLRKIIKEEFEGLIRPFEQEVFKNFNKVESDIINLKKNNNNIFLNSKNDLYKFQNLRENKEKNLYDYVPFKDFEKKMKDLEEKIEKKDKNKNMALDTMSNDIKNVKREIQKLKNKYKEIEELNKLEAKKYYDGNESDKNDEKLKDNEDKITFLQKNFEKLRKNLNDIKNNANIKILDEYFYKYDEFYVYDRCKKFIDNIKGYDEFIDYYKLIKVGIYYLKNYS